MNNALIALVVLAILIAAPLATIASINVLFGTAIPFELTSWLAAFWLTAVFAGSQVSKK